MGDEEETQGGESEPVHTVIVRPHAQRKTSCLVSVPIHRHPNKRFTGGEDDLRFNGRH